MSLTLAQARDDMLKMISDAWLPTGKPILYEDRGGTPPKEGTAWARVTIRHNRGDQETLSNPFGSRLFRRDGLVFVQIFTPVGNGLEQADALAKIALDAYEGKSSQNGVWFRNVRYREVGPDGNWYQVNVIAEFEYSEAK